MTLRPLLVSRTRGEWRATARLLRTQRPELAAKITLARLADLTARMDEPLTIAFTRPEYERLVAAEPEPPGEAPTEDEVTATVAAIEAFLALPSSRAREPR